MKKKTTEGGLIIMMINNFEELKSEVRARLSVTDILRGMTTIDNKGNGICPFHHDRKKGNFKVYEKTNTYHCFACGAHGDAFQLMQMQKGTDFITTTYELGYELGLICEDEMKQKRIMTNVREKKPTKKTTPVVVNANPIKKVTYETKAELTTEEIRLYDLAYRVLSSYCGLDEADKQHLLNDRKINPDKLNDYFSLRDLNKKNVVNNTVNKLKALGVTKEQIVNIPGFAYTKDKRIHIATHVRGLGMKIRNTEGKVIGIQIRTELEDKKYLWLSSSRKGGKGSSTPVSIEYPKMILDGSKLNLEATLRNSGDSILITEGKFKAEALSKEFQNVSFGIAGINNWRNKVKKEFINITSRKNINNIVVFADADCAYNPAIFMQFKEMLNTELKDVIQNIYIAHWNIKHGKGIDDVIHSGNKDKVKYLKLNKYAELFHDYLEKINEFNIDDVNANKEDKIKTYNKIFNL